MKHVTITNEDLGIKDGKHSKKLTPLEASCVGALELLAARREEALPANELACEVFDDCGDQDKRNLRELVNHLVISHKIPICSMGGKGGGYWLPSTKAEEEAVYEARRKRAMTGLMKMSRGRKGAYVDTIEQLTLWFDEPEGARAIEKLRLTPERDPLPAWLKLVTRLLDRIDRAPQKYALELAELQRQFGARFIPKEVVEQLKKNLSESNELLKKIA